MTDFNNQPRKILVIRFGAMGDLVHVSPALTVVKETIPDCQLDLLTSPMYESFASQYTCADQVWGYNKKTGLAGLWGLAQQLRQEEYDVIINLHPSLRTHLLLFLVNPKEGAHYKKEKIRIKGFHQRQLARKHAIEDFYSVFQQALDLPQHTIRSLTPHALDQAIKKPVIGIIPGVGNKRSNRAWLPEYYSHLIDQLYDRYPEYQIHLLGGPDETELANSIIRHCQKHSQFTPHWLQNHCGQLSIEETVEQLGQCAVVISGDTGPIHLATLGKSPIIALYGPTSITRTGPVTEAKTTHLLPPDSLSCWPCELAECPLEGNEHLQCMKEIKPQQVLQAIEQLLP